MSTPQGSAFPRRSEIYFVDFDPTRGSEQGGKRPALIVSNNVANEHSPTVTVVAVTHTIPKKAYPQNVSLPPGVLDSEGGTVFCGQVLTVAKERLGNYVGALSPTLMNRVDLSIRAHFDV